MEVNETVWLPIFF